GNAFLLAARMDPLEARWLSQLANCALTLDGAGADAPSLPLPPQRASGRISFVVCSITPAKLEALKTNIRRSMRDESWELVHIDDARSLAEGYNRGLDRATGELIVLCHDDIEFVCTDFEEKLRSHLAEFDMVGVAGSTRVSGP